MTEPSAMLCAPPRKRMSARFEYTRLTGRQIGDALAEIDLLPAAFCRIFGVRKEVMRKWLKDEQEPPPWVFVVLWLLREVPNGIAIARTAAANHIRLDREHPEYGEFPYLISAQDDGDGV